MIDHYQKTVLENGIRVVSETMESVRSVTIGIWILAGSRYENQANNGIFHLLEHMLFKGTKTRSAYDIAISLEAHGGHINGFTEKEMTCIYAVVLDKDLAEAIDVLADIVQNPVLNKQDLINEKQIIHEEISNLEDSPEDLVQEHFLKTVFDTHPLGFPILGTKATVQNITHADLFQFHQSFYTSDRIIISAAGCVDHLELVKQVESCFTIVKKDYGHDPLGYSLNNQTCQHYSTSTMQSHICMGYPACSFKDKKKYPLILLNALLGGSMSSRFFQLLREEEGLAYSVYSYMDFWSDIGLWTIYVGSSPSNISRVIEILENELIKLNEQGIEGSELENMKSQICGNLILSLEDSTSRMNRLAKYETFVEEYMSMDDTVRKIQSVSLDDIQKTIKDVFDNKNRFITLLEPVSNNGNFSL